MCLFSLLSILFLFSEIHWRARSNHHTGQNQPADRQLDYTVLTPRTSEAGIPALRKLPCGVAHRYTGFAQTSLWRRMPVYRLCFLKRTGTRMPES